MLRSLRRAATATVVILTAVAMTLIASTASAQAAPSICTKSKLLSLDAGVLLDVNLCVQRVNAAKGRYRVKTTVTNPTGMDAPAEANSYFKWNKTARASRKHYTADLAPGETVTWTGKVTTIPKKQRVKGVAVILAAEAPGSTNPTNRITMTTSL
jgi:hypothetical protein